MSVVAIIGIIITATTLCWKEIPKMLNKKYYRELCAFAVLLVVGTVLVVLRSIDVPVASPLELLTWIYSPLLPYLKRLMG